jgi:predicted transcriptional regulator
MPTHTITLTVDDDLYRELEVIARDRQEEVAQTAQRAIMEYARSYIQQLEAEKGFPQA